MIGYLLLFVTVALGVAGNICIRLSAGFSRRLPSVLVFLFYGLCTYFLTLTVQHIEMGVVYAAWSGAGVALVAAAGMYFFGESRSTKKLGAIALIVAGVVLLHAAPVSAGG